MRGRGKSSGESASSSAIGEGRQSTPTPVPARPKRTGVEPEQGAKGAIARRAKPGAPPGHVRLVLTLELRQALAEQLSARAIHEGRNLEAVLIDLHEAGAKQ